MEEIIDAESTDMEKINELYKIDLMCESSSISKKKDI